MLAVAVVLVGMGVVQVRAAQVEAFPDFGPTRVEVQTEALGLSAEEVENLITNPMEQEFFNGMPWLHQIRSDSLPGLSRLDLVFEPGTDPTRARQVVQERLTMVRALPAVSKSPAVIQPTSTTSRLMMIGLSSSDVSLIDLSVLARWKLRQRLIAVPGVANVSIWGMRDRQLQVLVDPDRLRKHHVPLDAVVRSAGNAMWSSPLTFVEASTPGTGGFIDNANQRIEIQHIQPIRTAKDLAQVAIDGAESSSLRLSDVADVVEDHQLLIGDSVTKDNRGLLLVVERFPGTSVTDVTREVEKALDGLRPGLAGISIDTTLYRPATFLESARNNLAWTLAIGALLLLLVLGALMFSWRAALVSLVAISASLALALLVLSLFGARLNMMILAGLAMAVAIVVDDAVGDVEHLRRRLRERRGEDAGAGSAADSKAGAILAAVLDVRGPLFVATVIVVVSVLPALALGEVSGAFLRPLALGYVLAVLASMVVALTLTPALAMLLFSESSLRRESSLARRLERGYAAQLGRLARRPVRAYAVAGLVLVASLVALPQIGGQHLTPALQDRDLLVRLDAAPGTSLTEMDRLMATATRELRALPGVRTVGAHVGRASLSDQVVAVNSSELWVSLDPAANYAATTAAIRDAIGGYPGLRTEVMTYPAQRVQEVDRSSDAPLVVRIYGRDYDVMRAKAAEVATLVSGVAGVREPRVMLPDLEPTVEVEVSITKAARVGVKPGDVRRAAAIMVSGITAGNLYEAQKVFDVVVWATPEKRHSLDSIRGLLIDTPHGGQVKLSDVADVRIRPNPANIRHDAVARYIDVTADVRGRGLDDVTRDVERSVRNVTFPAEHHVEVLGESAQRENTQQRALGYAIAALVVLFFLLQACFGSWRLATLHLLLLPVALAGAVLVAAVRRDVMSVVSLFGLLTVLAITIRGSILQTRHYQRLEQQGVTAGPDLVLRGSRERFGPTVTAALATALALTPLLLVGVASGLEVLQPLVAIVLGGLVTATLVNLFLLPALYLRFATTTQKG
ncbi:MAG TPA: efflux RND transporter permease subunit [Mycobacteriales bacterium]|nr:efflux RND transporter permease subunit [Mycobacteriales bacterium]